MIMPSLVHSTAMRAFSKLVDALAAVAAGITGEHQGQATNGKPNIGGKEHISYII